MDNTDIVIIGAGVIGLAISAELSQDYENIVVLEKEDSFGRETSSRNSEVIHSGIYYPEGSLKSRLCVEGAQLLYEICEKQKIAYKKLGKLIVALEKTDIRSLHGLFEKGKRNNVKGLVLLDKEGISKLDPHTNAIAAIYSPNTGIIDSHALMKYYFSKAKEKGVLFVFKSEVNYIMREGDGFSIGIKQDDYQLKTRMVINCAGLCSDVIAAMAGVDINKNGYKIKFCKGSYFYYSKYYPLKMLVYPLPHTDLSGLGIHASFDLGNRLRFGPDVEYVESINYNVDTNKKNSFYERASKLLPGLDINAFVPDTAGVRPKLYAEGEPIRDFVINDESRIGLRGLIDLIGIESPGLTASPAIARMVKNIVREIFAS
jgi:L-2-hydroxyglutarate oxidase LhgO